MLLVRNNKMTGEPLENKCWPFDILSVSLGPFEWVQEPIKSISYS